MLPRLMLPTFVVAVLAALAAASADAQARCFYAVESGDWADEIWNTTGCGDPANLSDPSPVAGDGLMICAGSEVTITSSKSADSLELAQGTAADQTKFIIGSGGTFTLAVAGVSTVNADAVIVLTSSTSKLTNAATVTITGAGSIEGQHNTAQIAVASGTTFTSQVEIVGSMEIRAGSGTFVNNGLVEANRANGNDDNMLTIYDGTIQSSDCDSEFKVATSGATLKFRSAVGDIGAADMKSKFTQSSGTGTLDINIDTQNSSSGTWGGSGSLDSCQYDPASQTRCPDCD